MGYVDEESQQSVDDGDYGPPAPNLQSIDDTNGPHGDDNPQCIDDYQPPAPQAPAPEPSGDGGAGGASYDNPHQTLSYEDCHPDGPNWFQSGWNDIMNDNWGRNKYVPYDCMDHSDPEPDPNPVPYTPPYDGPSVGPPDPNSHPYVPERDLESPHIHNERDRMQFNGRPRNPKPIGYDQYDDFDPNPPETPELAD